MTTEPRDTTLFPAAGPAGPSAPAPVGHGHTGPHRLDAAGGAAPGPHEGPRPAGHRDRGSDGPGRGSEPAEAAPRAAYAHGRTRVRRRRAVVVGAATAAALLLWVVLDPVAGLDLAAPGMGGQPGSDLGAGQVLASALVASLAGWTVLAVLERFTRHARRAWLVVSVVVLLVSLGGPLSGAGVTAAQRAALVAFHLVVAAVLVPGLAATSRR